LQYRICIMSLLDAVIKHHLWDYFHIYFFYMFLSFFYLFLLYCYDWAEIELIIVPCIWRLKRRLIPVAAHYPCSESALFGWIVLTMNAWESLPEFPNIIILVKCNEVQCYVFKRFHLLRKWDFSCTCTSARVNSHWIRASGSNEHNNMLLFIILYIC